MTNLGDAINGLICQIDEIESITKYVLQMQKRRLREVSQAKCYSYKWQIWDSNPGQ